MIKLMLDSGAWSVWRSGKSILLKDYIRFVEKWGEYIKQVVNLDVIPGSLGRSPGFQEYQDAAEQGFKNALALRKRGIPVIPVFHQGETFEWLDRYIQEGFDYIGLGFGNSMFRPKVKLRWLDDVFNRLCGDKGYPHVKVHGFGINSVPLIYRYPWFSIDGASWVRITAWGCIMVPHATKSKDGHSFDFSQTPFWVRFSRRVLRNNSSRAATTPQFYSSLLGDGERRHIEAYLDFIGVTADDLEENDWRHKANIRFLQKTCRLYRISPWIPKGAHLFRNRSSYGRAMPCNSDMRIRMYYAGSQSEVLTEEGANRRLESYAVIGPKADVKRFVETGSWKEKVTA